MNQNLDTFVAKVCKENKSDPSLMMNICIAVQREFGCVSDEAIELIAKELNTHRVEVESVVSFYAFLSKEKKGKFVIRLCNDIIDKLQGSEKVARSFENELGIKFGQTTDDGMFTLEYTPCIGLCDQAPAALVNDVPVTYLSSDKAVEVIKTLKKTGDAVKLVHRVGDGNNANPLVHSMVHNGIRKKGLVVFDDDRPGSGLKKALSMSPAEVIREIKNSRLRGRGGAGFPTGMKWEFTRAAEGDEKYVLCNADEGEPGTFKDRAILTEHAGLMIEGMTIAGYAIGAKKGVVYLRGEYAYLTNFLEDVLDEKRAKGLLGKDIMGKKGFDFDVRMQLGAGAYICGEETSLISSCEGLRGDPKNRPPFPAQKGYLGKPTTVNNVETFCCVTRIMDKGSTWFAEVGSAGSPSNKLLSVSGDCQSPGVYEYPFGIKVSELLKDVGATDAKAVQIGGPSGQLIGPSDYDRIICYDDLATGGSIMIFGPDRDLLEVVDYFMEFFIEESCGYCTPCRVGNVLLKEKLDDIRNGKGEPEDIDYLVNLGESIEKASRCGLGQTSPNPILSSIKNFRSEYDKLIKEKATDGTQPDFDIYQAIETASSIAGRKSEIYK